MHSLDCSVRAAKCHCKLNKRSKGPETKKHNIYVHSANLVK